MSLAELEHSIDEYSLPPLPEAEPSTPLVLPPEVLARIDPNGTLPDAVVSRRSEQGLDPLNELRHRYEIASADEPGVVEAYCNVTHHVYDRYRYMDYVRLTDEGIERGRRGFGLLIYLAAIEDAVSHGDRFETSPARLSDHARTVWHRLVKSGVAEAVTPFRTHPEDEDGFFGGLSVVTADTIGKHNSN